MDGLKREFVPKNEREREREQNVCVGVGGLVFYSLPVRSKDHSVVCLRDREREIAFSLRLRKREEEDCSH